METSGTVVVGVDGTPASRAALEHAPRDAGRRTAMRVVAVAQLPEYWEGVYGVAAMPPPEQIEADLRGAVKEEVDGVVAASPQLSAVPITITIDAVLGQPGRVLADAAEGADVLVLGHRGRGAVRSALFGYVGLFCVLHAPCPVTIVPAAETDEQTATA